MAIITVGFNPAIDRVLECRDFHVGGHQSARQLARLAAGKAANVSRALALVGADSIATGFVGTEELEFFHTELMATGPGRILCHFIEVAGRTRENISILDTARFLETHLRDRGFAASAAEKKLLAEKLSHDVRAPDVVIFAGSLCEGVDSDYFTALVNQCQTAGARVVVDTSGAALRDVARKNIWLLKPNLLELRQWLGRDVADDPAEIRLAVNALPAKPTWVLVSRGEKGAVLIGENETWHGHGNRTAPVVRTVGCGDHLLAGFVSEMLAGRSPAAALRMALALATTRATATSLADFDRNDLKTANDATEVFRLP